MKKHLRLFCVTLLLVACGTMWAGEWTVTFTAGIDKSGNTVTKDGIVVSMSVMDRTDNYRTYKGKTMTVSLGNLSKAKAITKIEITCTASGIKQYGPGCFTGEGYTYSGNSGKWEGYARSVSLTALTYQVRMTKVVVTCTDADPESISVSIGKVGYSTLYYSDMSLEVPEGVKAYTVTVDGSRINLAETGSIVPAGEAVVLKGATGEHVFNVSNATVEKAAANLLKGCDEATAVSEEGYKYYMLATKNGQNLGFYYEVAGGATINCKAHKAYLPIPSDAPAAAKSFFLIDDGTTAITLGAADEAEQAFFNLAGQRVESPRRGLYVVKGKKVLLK